MPLKPGSRARAFFVRAMRGPAPWVVLLLIAANLAARAVNADLLEERRRNLLTVGVTDGRTGDVRFDASVGEDLARYWPNIPDARREPLVILCGMSQMYAINERKDGDQTIAEWMDDALARKGVRVFGLAAPNLSNEEALLLLLATVSRPETRPRAFTYGVCFDKFRNVDLREGYRRFLDTSPGLKEAWIALAHTYAGRYPKATEAMLGSLDASAAPSTREIRIRDAAAAVLPLVAARKELNARAQTLVFEARNWVFRIKPTSKRPILKSRYALNQELLELMIEVAKDNGVAIPLYVIPLNPLAENPYVPEEYAGSVAWLAELCRATDTPYANLEHVVPSEHWGEFMGGPDFKHFKGEGHRITANAILDAFRPLYESGR